mgnify:CR=1 FL=1|tara:strand:+ start:50 stop:1747 length:1698 start_codon:yes stop_codon:yes gene_type:complete
MNDVLVRARARAAEIRQRLGIKTEMERILELPHQDFSTRTDLVNKWTGLLGRPNCTMPLRPVQAEILEECSWASEQASPIGMIGNVGVGKGKTLAFFLVPEIFDAKSPVLIIPSSMRNQCDEDLWFWSRHYKFRKPLILTYSQLSQPASTGLLRQLSPDLIMADEAHCFRHASAARTKRFLRYMRDNPSTRFVAMSGTLTGSTLSDYAHLCALSLREGSPVPRDDRDVAVWGSVLNSDGEPDEQAWATLAPLDLRAVGNVMLMRQAFNRRFRTTPGVVCTETASCDAKLKLTALHPELAPEVTEALLTLEEEFALPNGLEIVDALHYHRAMRQLSVGFYYVWDWPEGEEDLEWLDARREWWSACRRYLTQNSREGCDSPFLVEEYVRERKPPGLYQALLRWDEQRHKPPPPTKPVWIDPGPVLAALHWLEGRDRALVWYGSKAVGDMLAAFGLPTFGAGDGTPRAESHPRAALAIEVHHKGRNYQAWNDQLIMEPMPNAATWEQLLGRTHRQGQTADVVQASVFQSAWPQRLAFQRALVRSRYIAQMTGSSQKLLLADKKGFAGE